MRYVKIFTSSDSKNLEKKINTWVLKHQVQILDLQYYSQGYRNAKQFEHMMFFSAVIIYEADHPIKAD
jgi:Sporulation protein Cse60